MNYKKISSHGSVNIPVRVRRELGIEPKDAMELEVQDGAVVIRPHVPRCVFCGTDEVAGKLYGKAVCRACAGRAYDAMKDGMGREGEKNG